MKGHARLLLIDNSHFVLKSKLHLNFFDDVFDMLISLNSIYFNFNFFPLQKNLSDRVLKINHEGALHAKRIKKKKVIFANNQF